jgi:hypothetical protein
MKDEMGGTCGTRGEDEECIRGFKTMKDEMGGTCGTRGEDEECIRGFKTMT